MKNKQPVQEISSVPDLDVSSTRPSLISKRILMMLIPAIVLLLISIILAISLYISSSNNTKNKLIITKYKKELQLKTEELDGLKKDRDALYAQMENLKEFSIARSTDSFGQPIDLKINSEFKAVDLSRPLDAIHTDNEINKSEASDINAEIKKHKKESCDLVGLSAQEQAETIKNCVLLMEEGKLKLK